MWQPVAPTPDSGTQPVVALAPGTLQQAARIDGLPAGPHGLDIGPRVFDSQRQRLCVFLPRRCEAVVYEEAASRPVT